MTGFDSQRPTLAESWTQLPVEKLQALEDLATRQAQRFTAGADRLDLERCLGARRGLTPGDRLLLPPGPREEAVGDHTNARVTFRRAIERGNLVVAEITARELGRLDLLDALELTALIAKRDPRVRGRRAGARWLRRWLDESDSPTIDDAVVVAGLLAGLGGDHHDAALVALRSVAQPGGGARTRFRCYRSRDALVTIDDPIM